MGPSGLEPLASSLSGTRSNQLSYEPDDPAWLLRKYTAREPWVTLSARRQKNHRRSSVAIAHRQPDTLTTVTPMRTPNCRCFDPDEFSYFEADRPEGTSSAFVAAQ